MRGQAAAFGVAIAVSVTQSQWGVHGAKGRTAVGAYSAKVGTTAGRILPLQSPKPMR